METTSGAPAWPGRRRGLPADLSLVIALALSGYVVLASGAVLQTPQMTRTLLAVLLGLGAGVVGFALVEAAQQGRLRSPAHAHDVQEATGWQVVEGIRFANVDIDHVAVGPSGVLAVETAHIEWPGPVTEQDLEELDAARRRARRGARRVRLILKSAGMDVEVEAALAVWGGGSQYLAPSLIEGVRILVGRDHTEWHDQLPHAGPELDPERVARMERTLRDQVRSATGLTG